MSDILNNVYLAKELINADESDNERLYLLRSYYKRLSELTDKFSKHPIDCGYNENEWAEEYLLIESLLTEIKSFADKYPYHVGLLRTLLANAPMTFPE